MKKLEASKAQLKNCSEQIRMCQYCVRKFECGTIKRTIQSAQMSLCKF